MPTVEVFFFVKIISIPDEELFSETAIGCTASYFVYIIDDIPVDFVAPHPHLRQCIIALFAVAEGWMLLDFEWFVLTSKCWHLCNFVKCFFNYIATQIDKGLNSRRWPEPTTFNDKLLYVPNHLNRINVSFLCLWPCVYQTTMSSTPNEIKRRISMTIVEVFCQNY